MTLFVHPTKYRSLVQQCDYSDIIFLSFFFIWWLPNSSKIV